MYPRVEYEMSEGDLEKIMNACRPVPAIIVGGYTPPSVQENANRAWERLGKKMGFDYMTVRPTEKGNRFFTAVLLETEDQKWERLVKEKEEKRIAEIEQLKKEIKDREDRLVVLKEADHADDQRT